MLRYYPGDDFVYRLKGSKKRESSYINNLYDTAIITGTDTIPFEKLDGVYFRRSTFGRRVCTLLAMGAVGFIAIDMFNEGVVQGKKLSFNRGDRNVSYTGGVSTSLIIYKKKVTRLNGHYRLIMVKKGSFFYKDDPKGFNTPYLPD